MSTPAAPARSIRRPGSSGSGSLAPSNTSSPISRGATARSAVPSPRLSSSLSGTPNRRPTAKTAVSPSPSSISPDNGHDKPPGPETITRNNLVNALKAETEEKEVLIVRLQDQETQLQSLRSEIHEMNNALRAAESRIGEFFVDQARTEDELAAHHAITDKLREQLRESEKEKRDLNRRYNEQTKSFEAERQSFYDNEQHLKSRIQSLTTIRKTPDTPNSAGLNGSGDKEEHSDSEQEMEEERETSFVIEKTKGVDGLNEDPTDTPEVTALKLELSTLSTSYNSLQSTLQHLQIQLADLQRVNISLQDENESYNILLREKTMTGQYDFLRQLGGGEEIGNEGEPDGRSIRSIGRSTLDRVYEEDEIMTNDERVSEGDPFEDTSEPRTSNYTGRRTRSGASSPLPSKGESLAGLPLTGPGLDLAAELGRAENKEFNDSNVFSNESPIKKKRTTRVSELKGSGMAGEMDSLRNEVKSLKDANKALSLYASKILDRIIAQDGFEHVLAADYNDENPKSPLTALPPTSPKEKKPRPQSAFFFGTALTNPTSPVASKDGQDARPTLSPASPASESKHQRRSMSFDWKSLSLWGGTERKAEHNPNLRPLTLRPGATSVVGAKKLDTFEDDEDRVERERLNATMKLMGIQPAPISSPSTLIKSASVSSEVSSDSSKPTKSTNRWSFFRSNSKNDSDSGASTPAKLTTEALQNAEAREALKQMDDNEQERIEALARGSGSGFTEMRPRSSISDEWKSRRDMRLGGSTGSGGTVWSAGREDIESGSRTLENQGSP